MQEQKQDNDAENEVTPDSILPLILSYIGRGADSTFVSGQKSAIISPCPSGAREGTGRRVTDTDSKCINCTGHCTVE